MKRVIVALVVGAIFGAMAGSWVVRYSYQQRRHALAAMWLSQFHLDALQTALHKPDCVAAARAVRRLHWVSDELPQLLPLAYSQDSVFHNYVDKFRGVTDITNTASCIDAKRLKAIQNACADCHRDYR